MLLQGFLALRRLQFSDIDGIAVSSGVPRITAALRDLADQYLDFEPIVIEPGVRTGIRIDYDNPKEVGADRIANAIAAFDLYGGPDDRRRLRHGHHLRRRVGQRRVPRRRHRPGHRDLDGRAGRARPPPCGPSSCVRPATCWASPPSSRSSPGAVYGFAAQVDGLCDLIVAELGECTVVSTGGLADLITPVLPPHPAHASRGSRCTGSGWCTRRTSRCRASRSPAWAVSSAPVSRSSSRPATTSAPSWASTSSRPAATCGGPSSTGSTPATGNACCRRSPTFAPTVLVHLGVYEPYARSGPRSATTRTAAGTIAALDACLDAGTLEAVVVRSGIEVYGRGPGTPVRPDEDGRARSDLSVRGVAAARRTGRRRRRGEGRRARHAPAGGPGRGPALPEPPRPGAAPPRRAGPAVRLGPLLRPAPGGRGGRPRGRGDPPARRPGQRGRARCGVGDRGGAGSEAGFPFPTWGPGWRVAAVATELAGAPLPDARGRAAHPGPTGRR